MPTGGQIERMQKSIICDTCGPESCGRPKAPGNAFAALLGDDDDAPIDWLGEESEEDEDSPPLSPKVTKTPLETSSPTSALTEHLGGDVEVSVLIVGGGPHALAVLSALHERSLAYPQFNQDMAFGMSGLASGIRKNLGLHGVEKVGTVCVLDRGHTFMEEWDARFAALEIPHLRSPAAAHPRAYEPQALMDYAVKHGRTSELIDPPSASYQRQRMATADGVNSIPLLYALPSTALFRDFCASLAAELPHTWVRGEAAEVVKDARTGKYRARYVDGATGAPGWIVADAVVLATGPASVRNVPAPLRPHVGTGCVTHTEEFLRNGETVASMASRLAGGTVGAARLLVVGGGLTAAQAAIAAVAAGARVVLRSRRPLMTRAYDLSTGWLDQRHATRLRSEFLTTSVEERLKVVKEEVHGGSVPDSYMRELRRLVETSGRLELQVGEVDEGTAVRVDGDGKDGRVVHVDGEAFDHVILATGFSTAPGRTPLYQQVEAEFALQTVKTPCGTSRFPLLDENLSWAEGADLYVVGANAVLELGPGALNLMGAMRGAKIVAEALRDVMWSSEHNRDAEMATNQFSKLNLGGAVLEAHRGCDDSGDDSDDDRRCCRDDDGDGEAPERTECGNRVWEPKPKRLTKAEMRAAKEAKAKKKLKRARQASRRSL